MAAYSLIPNNVNVLENQNVPKIADILDRHNVKYFNINGNELTIFPDRLPLLERLILSKELQIALWTNFRIKKF